MTPELDAINTCGQTKRERESETVWANTRTGSQPNALIHRMSSTAAAAAATVASESDGNEIELATNVFASADRNLAATSSFNHSSDIFRVVDARQSIHGAQVCNNGAEYRRR